MPGTPSSERGSTHESQRFPWQIGFAAFVWAVLGVTSIVMALGAGGSRSDADSSSVGQVRESLGESSANVATTSGPNPVFLVGIGLVILLLTVLLLIGQGWARLALTAVGAVAVIYFALSGRWEAVVAMIVLVLGSVPLLSRRATNYFAG